MTTIHLETDIGAPIELVFDLARDIDLHQRSMSATDETAIAGRTRGRIELGETVTWQARHFGRWWALTSVITECVAPRRLVDEQVSGPFKAFRHVHTLRQVPTGTVMIDDWVHVAPLGPLGWLADRLVLSRHMRRLLRTRNAYLKAAAEATAASDHGGRVG